MFKWFYYWKLGREQKKQMARLLDEARKLPPYTPDTAEVLAFIEEFKQYGHDITKTHYIEQVQPARVNHMNVELKP